VANCERAGEVDGPERAVLCEDRVFSRGVQSELGDPVIDPGECFRGFRCEVDPHQSGVLDELRAHNPPLQISHDGELLYGELIGYGGGGREAAQARRRREADVAAPFAGGLGGAAGEVLGVQLGVVHAERAGSALADRALC
jgi:hypothetical protein